MTDTAEESNLTGEAIKRDMWLAYDLPVDKQVDDTKALFLWAMSRSTEKVIYERDEDGACVRVLGPSESEVRFCTIQAEGSRRDQWMRSFTELMTSRLDTRREREGAIT